MNAMMPLLKRAILIATILFLTSFTLPAANRSTCPTFGSRAVDAISQTVSIPNRCQQIGIAFHYEITVSYIPTHHSSQCRRHGITHHGPQGHDYTYTGNNLLETYADTAGRIAKYTYGNALISQSDATGSSESVVTDYQNSVIALLNPSTIHDPLSTAFAYDPFGKVRYTSSEGVPQTLGWLSRQYDSETGNNYLINRYYNADRGGFLSPDRYQYVQTTIPFTLNLYQYAYANPLVNVDPEGLQTFSENEQGFADYSKAFRVWKKISDKNPHVTLQTVKKALSEYGFTKSGSFERYIYTQRLPEDFTGATDLLYHTDQGYLFKEEVTFNKEGQLSPILTPVEITMKDSNEFRRVPGLGEFWEGLTFNSMSSDATRLYRNADGSLNIGFILGHTLQVGLDVLTTGEFKTRTPAVEVEKLSDLSLHTSSYVNTDVPVLNKLLTDERGFVRIGKEELEDKGVYPLLTQRGVRWKSSKTGKFVAAPGRGVTVLGHWDDYAIKAREIGATYYSLPKVTWDRLTREQRWQLNQLFLDKAIERGDTFIFATHWERKFSYYGRELWYFRKKGIDVSAVEKRWENGF